MAYRVLRRMVGRTRSLRDARCIVLLGQIRDDVFQAELPRLGRRHSLRLHLTGLPIDAMLVILLRKRPERENGGQHASRLRDELVQLVDLAASR